MGQSNYEQGACGECSRVWLPLCSSSISVVATLQFKYEHTCPASLKIQNSILDKLQSKNADQVKSIKNQAIVNETPQEKLIRELKEENEKLKALVEGKTFNTSDGGAEAERLRQEYEKQIEELRRAKEEAERT